MSSFTGYFNDIQRIDLARNTSSWVDLTGEIIGMPSARFGCSMVSVLDSLFLFGGQDGGGPTAGKIRDICIVFLGSASGIFMSWSE